MAFLTLPTMLDKPTIVRAIAKTAAGSVSSFTISDLQDNIGLIRSKGANIIVTDGNPGPIGTRVTTGVNSTTTTGTPALELSTQNFTGDGITTVFTLDELPNTAQLPTATVDGTATAITVAGIQVSFVDPPANTDAIIISYVAKGAGWRYGVVLGTPLVVGQQVTVVSAASSAITSHLTNNLSLQLPIELEGLIEGTNITGIFI